MRSTRVSLPILFFLLSITPVLHAATYVVPSDAELTNRAQRIVVGVVGDSRVQRASNGMIETITDVVIEESIKGESRGRIVRIASWGGVLGDEFLIAHGEPVYQKGDRVLLFLEQDRRAEWRTWGLGLGVFWFERTAGGEEILTRDRGAGIDGWSVSGEAHVEHPRLAKEFLEYVRQTSRGREYPALYEAFAPPQTSDNAIIRTDAAFGPKSYTSRFGGPADPTIGIRRNGGNLTVSWRLWGSTANVDMPAAVDYGNGKWNAQSALINYSRSGTAATGNTVDVGDGEHRVVANDPNGVVSLMCCPGVVATAFSGGSLSTFTFGGDTFYPITGSDIVSNDGAGAGTEISGITQTNYNTAMAHELGHTLGLRHADRTTTNGTPCSSDPALDCCVTPSCQAIMQATVPNSKTTLLQWDKDAIDCLYDGVCASGACTGPSITTQPASSTIIGGGQTAALSVSATGTGTLHYAWFQGAVGVTTTPVGTDSPSFTTPALLATTSYWVRVTDACDQGDNTEDSALATVTVNCNPTITSQPSNKTITQGASATLTVASAQATSFQWYDVTATGLNTDESTPVGTNSTSFNTGVLNDVGVKKYWVKASTVCGSTRSNVATVTVNEGCTAVFITALNQPQSVSIAKNGTATLTVTPSGTAPFTYQWYKGASPSLANPIGGATSATFTTPALTATTQYWVRVKNTCGGTKSTDSNTATVTVVSCTLPVISAEPLDTSVAFGTAATLSVTTDATSVTWYMGALGDKSTPIGSGATITTQTLTSTATFWAELTNSCGSVSTRLVTVTVAAACVSPTITVQPLSQNIQKGGATNLSVVADGSQPVAYQWYQGMLLDTSTPVGGGQSTFATPALTRTTFYWVRVTNACGFADSAQAVVSVPSEHRRAVRK